MLYLLCRIINFIIGLILKYLNVSSDNRIRLSNYRNKNELYLLLKNEYSPADDRYCRCVSNTSMKYRWEVQKVFYFLFGRIGIDFIVIPTEKRVMFVDDLRLSKLISNSNQDINGVLFEYVQSLAAELDAIIVQEEIAKRKAESDKVKSRFINTSKIRKSK
ncbi:hypothetical protein CWC25_12255 [Pseudoalteromonas sp. S4389]|nr:hypothetical protein CWC25_12255 [Pseudoalteromonas sp. S4389]